MKNILSNKAKLHRNWKLAFVLLFIAITFSSCSNGAEMFEDALPNKINNIGDFIVAVFTTLVASVILSMILSMIMGGLADIVTLVIIFIFLLNAKDYSFFTALFIMIFAAILSNIINNFFFGSSRSY